MVDDGTDDTVRKTVQGVTPNRASTDPAAAQTIAVGSDVAVPDRSDAPTSAARPRDASSAPAELGSRYRLGEPLGEGGMGEVILAFDEQIGREVAIKRIRLAEPTAEALSRFLREARVQGRLEHPAIVPVYDLAVDRTGRPFFVMKRLTGTLMSDLIRVLHEGTAIDVIATRARLLRAFADVCLAIEFAHSKGIVHRDLKPSNIMLGDFGEVYVLDWGIARADADAEDSAPRMPKADLSLESGETQLGTVLGTPAYMAPEQLVGERATAAADIYALGCILFEIVAGAQLHKQRSTLAALTSIDARPSMVRPDAPPELDVICVHATKLEPRERPLSARALGDAVQAYLDGDRDLAMRKQL
ncbi:MAG TPA: serine/threonine-protein kinase, partial [Kofleriaceae bacterium]|nr:serine/threonine-protein kinase [Kofleriaceae bacterium]